MFQGLFVQDKKSKRALKMSESSSSGSVFQSEESKKDLRKLQQ